MAENMARMPQAAEIPTRAPTERFIPLPPPPPPSSADIGEEEGIDICADASGLGVNEARCEVGCEVDALVVLVGVVGAVVVGLREL
jgi:hypothetical protein